jgi:hypothetical protein
MAEEIPQATYFQTVRQVSCPNCGGELEIINKRTRYVGCKFCGAQLDTSQEEAQLLLQLESPGQYPPLSFIDLGSRAQFDGVDYIVVGRRRWYADYYEYWSEWDEGELEQGYDRETWSYDEWLLLSQYQTFFFIVEDQEGYKLVDEIVPWQPELPEGAQEGQLASFPRLNLMGGAPKVVREFGTAQVLHTIGESTYRIQAGDRTEFAAYWDEATTYQVEWRRDEEGGLKEIEFFRQRPVDKATLQQAFGLLEGQEQGASLEAVFEDDTSRFSREAVLNKLQGAQFWGYVSYGCLALALVFLVLLFIPGREKTVTEAEFALNFDQRQGSPLPNENNSAQRNSSPGNDPPPKVYFLGDFPVQLTNPAAYYTFRVNTSTKGAPQKGGNQFLQIGLEIAEPMGGGDTIPVRQMQNIYETGAADEHTADFSIQAPGTFKTRVFAQPEFDEQSGEVFVTVEQHQPKTNYWIGFFVFLVLGAVWYFRSLYLRKRWEPYKATATQDLLGNTPE